MADNTVADSTVYFYRSCRFTPDKNWKMDNFTPSAVGLEASDGWYPVYHFQYIKHQLELEIVVDDSQLNLEMENVHDYNYVIIQNSVWHSTPVGYFVTKREWKGTKAIKFYLRMDTVNSCLDRVELSDLTKIKRKHKDRFIGQGGNARVVLTHNFVNSDFYDDNPEELMIYQQEWYKSPELQTYVFDLKKYLEDVGEHMDVGIVFGAEQQYEVQSCSVYVYFLDENKNVISQIGDATMINDAEDFRLRFGHGEGNKVKYWIYINDGHQEGSVWIPGHWEWRTADIPVNAQYVAFKTAMTFNYDVPSDEETLRFKFEFLDYQDFDMETYHWFKDRIQNYFIGYGNLLQTTQKFLYPVIDRYSENINPQLYGVDNFALREDSWLDQSWYLVYKNQNDPTQSLTNPVDCFLYGERRAKISEITSYTGNYTVDDLVSMILKENGYDSWEELERDPGGYQYRELYLTAHDNSGGHIVASGTMIGSFDYTMGNFGLIRIGLGPTDYPIIIQAYNENGQTISGQDAVVQRGGSISFTGCRMARVGGFTVDEWTAMGYAETNLFGTSSSTTIYTNPITSVDRTDPKLIKIIKLPYCPTSITLDKNSDKLVYDNTVWSFNNAANALKLINMNTKFVRDLEFTQNPFLPLNPIQLDELPLKYDKSDIYETKLYHSDFFQPKFFYDSFGFTFQLELMWRFIKSYDKFLVKYNVSNTLNSRFMFTFPDYICTYTQTKDFNNMVYVSRNNECAIFNQQYVNYIRDGYNYEKKANELRNSQQWLQMNTGAMMGMVTSGINGYESGGIGGALMNVGTGIVNSYLRGRNIATSIALQEVSMAQKQAQLQNQATGVIDANDVDLLDAYCGNRAMYKIYQVSPRMKKALFDLFYYTGYTNEEQGIPNTHTRLYFDFVMAEPVFRSTAGLAQNIIEDLKERYGAGITFFHSYKGVYNFDQTYENWEVSLLPIYGG